MKTFLIPTALFALAGISTAQSPTAPAPRSVAHTTESQALTAPNATPTPKLNMVAKDGKIEVRWKMQGESYTVIATRAVLHDDMVSFAGTVNDPVVMTGGRGMGTTTGLHIDVALREGRFTVYGTDRLNLPR